MDVCYQYQGAGVFDGPYNIGCYAWELTGFPDAWVGTLDYLHEVWAQTRFIQQSIADKTGLPVIWMPYAVEPGAAADMSRADFGLPEDGFLFLFFFDFRSYPQRKNPWAVMEAFARAFPPGEGARVHLVIKVNGADEKPEELAAFKASPLARDPRVQIIDRLLDDRGINALVCRCDCFVSLHRSEGFGRGLAEAMYFGKPVIATAYSGNLDFMNPLNACMVENQLIPVEPGAYPYGEGQLWADPDIEHAAWYMRRLVNEPAYADEIGARASAYIREHHSYRTVGAMYRRRLERLGLIDTSG
jgi:glycosyltransferase involved in cell wall biosynthesis